MERRRPEQANGTGPVLQAAPHVRVGLSLA
jgi:hypothetical protein